MTNLIIMLKKSVTIFIVLSFASLVSCKKKEIDSFESNSKEIQKSITYSIDFPDTVFVNQLNNGIIHYKSALDTIIETFGDKKKNRYTRFILTTTNNVNYDFKHLKLIAKDTFGALNNREIPFYDIKFNSPGIYFIDGRIDDIVLLDTLKKSNNDSLELIRNGERVTHKVVVIKK